MRQKYKDQDKVRPIKKRDHYGVSIRWKLIVYMAIFAAIILLITGFFQIFLLDSFFQMVKRNEIEETATEVSAHIGADDLEEVAYRAALDHALGIVIYRMDKGAMERTLYVDASGSQFPLMLSAERLSEYYQKATQEDGFCFARITAFGGSQVKEDSFWDKFDIDRRVEHRISNRHLRLQGIQLVTVEDGTQYMILLSASIRPQDSTVRTLATQYTWIIVIVVLLASVMVLFLYQRISQPIIQMNNSAKLLANGRYDVTFEGEGYRETCELADTLNYASHELSQLDRLQKELIANISHDLRTPLTMIKGYGEVMRDLPGENTPENIQVIIDETTRLSELVNDLLDLSRLQAGMRKPQPTTFDMTVALKEVMERYEAFTRHQGYDIRFNAAGSVLVLADRSMILQVLYNLVNNAVNYTGEDQRVTVVQTVSNGRVRISVTDTGAGIAPEEMPLIWNRYYKVDKLHRRAVIGTGLGLSIVKDILEAHGAAYGVNSTPGVGSTFWFELPTVDTTPNHPSED